jgi:hypothetical protein
MNDIVRVLFIGRLLHLAISDIVRVQIIARLLHLTMLVIVRALLDCGLAHLTILTTHRVLPDGSFAHLTMLTIVIALLVGSQQKKKAIPSVFADIRDSLLKYLTLRKNYFGNACGCEAPSYRSLNEARL